MRFLGLGKTRVKLNRINRIKDSHFSDHKIYVNRGLIVKFRVNKIFEGTQVIGIL